MSDAPSAAPDFASLGIAGLDQAAVAERVSRGATNDVKSRTSRSYAEIVRANVFTWFNLILGALWVLQVTYGSLRDALFGFVLLFNAAIGIAQEVRAKVVLDRLTLVAAPRARVVREGGLREIAAGEVVLDDVLFIEVGDQVVADGEIVWTDGLEIDEALLTGESAPMQKPTGAPVMAGTFAVAGLGAYRALAVGADTRAERIAAQGRRYVRVDSEVLRGINAILKVIGVLIVPVGALLALASIRASGAGSFNIADLVAPLVGMVPEGLVLLSSISFAAAAVVLARHRVLTNELGAVEVLARVDTLCADKTGTLTDPEPVFGGFEAIEPAQDAEAALGALARANASTNATARAIAAAVPDPSWRVVASAPFSSARKWSGARFADGRTWVLGAPEVLLDAMPQVRGDLRARADALAGEGPRVLLLAESDRDLPAAGLPSEMRPVGFAVLTEAIRPDALGAVGYLGDQGVAIKVLSGDAVETVSAIAAKTGVPGASNALDARTLPEGDVLADAMERATVFGRVAPEQKSGMIEALKSRGHTVAMVGDGVNDVLAVKSADLGIAMGSGAAATRAVAQLVLLDGRFAEVPLVMSEGRRVLANAERVANLFLTKTVWATSLALVFGMLAAPYPFLPRQITLIGSVTIGIPAFFLALAPNSRSYRSGFVRRVLRFTVPCGVVVASAIAATYAVAVASGAPLPATRTACTLVTEVLGLWVIASIEHPLRGWRLGLVLAMAAGAVLALVVPFAGRFFALVVPGPGVLLPAAVITALGCAIIGVLGARPGTSSPEATSDER